MNNFIFRSTHLSVREKQTILALAFFVISLFGYFFIWIPLSNQVTALRDHIDSKSEQLSWMKEADARIQLLEKNMQSSNTSSQSISSIAQAEITKQKLTKNITTFRQIDNQSLQISFHTISFDDLILWLTELATKQNLQVTQFSATMTDSIGLVNADIILKT